MVVVWPLIFLRQGQICPPHPHPPHIYVYGENVEKSFSLYVLKTYGWNLQNKIDEVKLISYRQDFGGYLPFPLCYWYV